MHIRSFRITLLPVVMAVLGTLMLVSPAKAQGADNICTPGPNQCLNLWYDNQNSGALVKWYHYGNSGGNNNWAITVVGHVVGVNCTNNCWPFYPGSGLNARYNGNVVATFTYWKNRNYCADQTDYDSLADYGNLVIQRCAGASDYQMFVWSGYGYLVPVFASDLLYFHTSRSNMPVWLGGADGNTSNGHQVTMSNEQSWSKPFVFVSSGG